MTPQNGNAPAERIAELTQCLENSHDPAERLTALLSLATIFRMTDAERSIAYTEIAFTEASEAHNWSWAAASLCDKALALASIANYRAALRTLRQAEKMLDEHDTNPQVRSLLYGNFAEISVLKSDYPAAMRWFRMALEMTSVEPVRARARAYCILNMGRMFVRLRDYPTALHYMSEALGMAEKMPDRELLAKTLDAIASCHMALRDPASARGYYERGYHLFRDAGLQVESDLAQLRIAMASMKLDELDDALPRIEMALASFRHSGVTYYVSSALNALAELRLMQGCRQAALELLEESLSINVTINNRLGEATTLNLIAETYLAMENVDCAALYVERSLAIAGELEDAMVLFACYEILSTIHERRGDPARSLGYLKMWIKAKEKVENMQAQRALVMLEMKGEIEKARAELERYRERQEAIEREAEQSRQELAAATLKLTQRAEREEKLEGKLRSYAERAGGDVAALLGDLLTELRGARSDEKRWDAFERQFEHLLPGFLRTLLKRSPALTPTELKVCSRVRINLSTKEIASILCTSSRTIDNHRRHIRVKMGLPARANLTTILASIE
jgi:tetratricopeptide (TPR) repeat protein/DNA-binding CsgD family transcriptional regulator